VASFLSALAVVLLLLLAITGHWVTTRTTLTDGLE
jgi:hypothetical protein